MCQSQARNDGFLVHDAALADPDYLSGLDARPENEAVSDRSSMGLFAHRLAPGQGTIVAHRFYSPGGALTIDDEVFEKLSIWFKSSRPESGAIPRSELQTFELQSLMRISYRVFSLK